MVVNVDSNLLHLYVDGEPVKSSPLNYSGELMQLGISAGENHLSGEYYIGSTKPDRGGGAFFTQHFKGLIGEIKIYNQILDAQEVYCLVKDC
jgi:hypothetical protein